MEIWGEIDKLLGAGFTIVFIIHTEEKIIDQKSKQTKWLPKGDKRIVDPLIDNSDLVLFLQSNGVDENGKVVLSTAYTAETDEWFARSRYTEMPPVIEEFTVESLETALVDAIKAQEKLSGRKAVSFSEFNDKTKSKALDFNALLEEANSLGQQYLEAAGEDENEFNKRLERLNTLIEAQLGHERKLSDAKEEQVEFVELIVIELRGLVA